MRRIFFNFIPVLQPVTMATLVLRSYSSIFGVASTPSLRATAITGRVERLQKTAKGPSKNVKTQVGINGNTIMLVVLQLAAEEVKNVGPSFVTRLAFWGLALGVATALWSIQALAGTSTIFELHEVQVHIISNLKFLKQLYCVLL
jgi:hypothetical protein